MSVLGFVFYRTEFFFRQCYLQDAMAKPLRRPILRACGSRQLLIHNHKMELKKVEIRILLNRYWNKIIKLLPWLEEYVKWKEKISLVTMWQNDGFNFPTLDRKY